MQKALFEMNVQLSNVISDIVGETGLRIIEAIITGQRDPMQLAALCSTRIKASRETVAKSLHGNWDEALLFALKAALEQKPISSDGSLVDAACPNQELVSEGVTYSLERTAHRRLAQKTPLCCPGYMTFLQEGVEG